MKRDVEHLKQGEFDLLVAGGGIYGSWVARHAAAAGLRVALVERSDWGSGTSSASSKLLHGGLRYLEQFEFGLVRKSLKERRQLHERLPHQVRPLRFLFPIYQDSRVGRFQLKLGLWLYDRLAGRGQPVGPHQSFSRDALVAEEPCLTSVHMLGGFSYGDCGTDDARMTLEVVASAIDGGATAANYVSVQDWIVDDGRIAGATLKDEETGTTFDLKTSVVVNTTGPWVFGLPGLESSTAQIRLTKGVHLVMPRLQSESAVLLTAKSDGRVFFLIPWYGRTLLGTTDTDVSQNPESVRVERCDVEYLLNAANDYLVKPWTMDDVHGTFVGVRTLQNEAGKSASSVSREWDVEEPIRGLLSSVGGKFTSARVDAASIMERVFELLDTDVDPQDPAMSWFPDDVFETWLTATTNQGTALGLDRATAVNCARRYGAKVNEVFALIQSTPDLAQPITAECSFCRAEIVHSARHEMSRTLIDILRRRIPLMVLSHLTDDVLNDASTLAGNELGWNSERRQQEITRVREQQQQQFAWRIDSAE
jgi:glycerol-3-phosphate dehydrogenase